MNRANLPPSLLGRVVASALAAVFLLPPAAQANPSAEVGTPSAGPFAPAAAFSPDDPTCTPAGTMDLEGRASPYDSVAASVGDARVKVCYGRPSARGRTMIGGNEHVPFGQLWRTGANEPTTLHVTAPVQVAGIALEAGAYSLYTRPGETTWEVFLNTSVDRWGVPINEEVRSHEIGSAELPRERPASHVETMTFTFEGASDDSASLVLEWEDFKISIPIRAG